MIFSFQNYVKLHSIKLSQLLEVNFTIKDTSWFISIMFLQCSFSKIFPTKHDILGLNVTSTE